jgi:histidine ammonia-lyase
VITLTGDGLTIDDVESVARGRLPVELSGEARERMAVARAVAERVAGGGERVYGLTTGLGALREIDQRAADAERYSAVTIQAHTTGHGPLVAGEIVRAAMLHRANALARGRSMVRPEVADAYVKALNDGFEPPVHAVGSVGQSDLPAMAEIARGLLEQGLRLEQGEALAMLNANSLSVGQAALAIAGLRRLLSAYDAVAALSLEGFAANLSMLHPEIPDARPYPGLAESVSRIRAALEGSSLWEPGAARSLQDPLSFRCIPQVHGALRDAASFAGGQIEIELNASGDNPMVVPAEDRVVSVGNFDITPVAAALDLLRLSLAHALTASGERVQKLLAEAFSGLPTGLRADDSPDDVLDILGVGAAALSAEARLLAMPVSLEMPTSTIAGGIEDHVTMAPLAARRLDEMLRLGSRLCAVEAQVAAQAVDLRRPPRLGDGTALVHRGIRRRVAFVGPGEAPSNNLDDLADWLLAGAR